MCHHNTALSTLGPEPDDWHAIHAFGGHRQTQEPLANILDSGIYRPLREGQLIPIARPEPLNLSSHTGIGKRPYQVIQLPENVLETVARTTAACITLQAKVIDYLRGVEWQREFAVVYRDVIEGIVEVGPDLRFALSPSGTAIADCI